MNWLSPILVMRAVFLVALVLVTRAAPASALGERFPGMTVERWQADVDAFAAQAPRTHGNLYRFVSAADFAAAVAELRARIPGSTDDAIVAGFARIVARLGDGHDAVFAPCGSGTATNFPLYLGRFDDGVLVTAASPALAQVVGARLTAIDGRPIDDVWKMVSPALAHDHDNDGLAKAQASRALTCSGLLHGVGAIASATEAAYTFARGGRSTTLRLHPEFAPGFGGPPPDWPKATPAKAPLWLSQPGKLAWYAWVEADGLFYVQINAIVNPPGTTLAAFVDEALRAADGHPVRSFVLDVRNNGGGNNQLEKPLIVGLLQRPQLTSRGHFFIITGPATFSAAQNLINRLESYAEPVFVGEPSGENVNFYGDTQQMTLPNSRLVIALANLYWQDKDPRDRRTATNPELYAPMTAGAYEAGRDPAYEAIVAHRDDAPLEAQLRTAARSGYDAVLRAYDAFARDPVHRFAAVEIRVNAVGYALLGEGDRTGAVAVFRVNADRHAQSWNAWDSLGEAYAAAGEPAAAIAAYERSLALNDANANGRAALAKLRAAAKAP